MKGGSFSSGILCGGQRAGCVQRSSFSSHGEERFFVPRKLFSLRLSMAHCFSESSWTTLLTQFSSLLCVSYAIFLLPPAVRQKTALA